jgi:hypothetical protein
VGAALGKIFLGLMMRLVTETFAAKLVVYCLNELAKSTDNKLDDKIVKAVSDALGIVDDPS